MFILATRSPPTTADELASALSTALAAIFVLPSGHKTITVQSTAYPAIDSLKIDLSGASVDISKVPPKPENLSTRETGPVVQQFQLVGRPISYERAGINLNLSASDVAFEYARDDMQRLLLVPAQVESGQVAMDVRHADLEALILAGAKAAAASHGVSVQSVQLGATSLGPRNAAINVRIVVKKLFVTATIRITGQLDVDDQLNASLSNLTCEGEGLIGSIATGILRPKLQQLEGRSFPLMAFGLGTTKLRNVTIGVGDLLTLNAAFSS